MPKRMRTLNQIVKHAPRITRIYTHKTINFRFYCDYCGQVDGTLELGNFVTISAINQATTLAAETHARAHSMKTIR
jgi:hypothetical protein